MTPRIKQALLLPLFLLMLNFAGHAQVNLTKPVEEYAIGKKTVVTNAAGLKYPYLKWAGLFTTGKYKLSPVNAASDSTAFVLALRDSLPRLMPMGVPASTLFFKRGNHFIFLNLLDVNGTQITAEQLRGKIVVINFWNIASPASRYQIPDLNQVAAAYKNDKDVIFLALTVNKKEDVQRYLNLATFNYQVIPDAEPYFNFYGVDQCPINLVINKTGQIRFQAAGYNNGGIPYWINRTIKEIKAEN
jgi:thiol-disulfide isomerase/thioredoxin